MAARPIKVAIYLEAGKQRTFALAFDWPGWARSGRGEELALESLRAYATRYAVVPAAAGIPFAAPAGVTFQVVERLRGDATTDFGAPGQVARRDNRPIASGEAARLARLLRAAWTTFDSVVKKSPAELRKGPRGGGRDRDVMVQHVLSAEASYVRKLGLKLPEPKVGDRRAIGAFRDAVEDAVSAARGRAAPDAKPWPVRYLVRRMAWHVMDHAWEMEDRSTTSG